MNKAKVIDIYTRSRIEELIRKIADLSFEAEEEREGPEMDLYNTLLKITREFKSKGRDYILERYWK